MEFKASLLASQGFAAFALAFYGVPGLHDDIWTEPNLVFDLEYFEKAIKLFCNHPQVCAERGVGIIGISGSSTMILALSVHIKEIKCVIWINGYLYPLIFSLGYKENVYSTEPFRATNIFDQIRDTKVFCGRHAHKKYKAYDQPKPEAVIKFYDQRDVAFMFIAGLDDESVPAGFYANEANRLLSKAKHPNFRILRYPGAGHLIEPPYSIHNHLTAQKGYEFVFNWGGSMTPHCRAQEESWLEQIEFLTSNIEFMFCLIFVTSPIICFVTNAFDKVMCCAVAVDVIVFNFMLSL
ncbi:bile acid-CoA:amino acid N-acyltransferase-like [Clavelina lepadiformis]|uniref:bile acid-CoA:amino acid N-acyltransferase-like n=1 Tax=Clavelina lepadiformis TaxID=159417 RepID=UPI004042D426